MKIVIATPFYPPEKGVLGMYAEGLLKAFETQGHEVVLVSLGSIRHLPPGIRHVAYFFRILRAARSSAFVLALDTWSVGMPAFWAARFARVPFLVRIGGDFLWESYVARTGQPIRLSEFYDPSRELSMKEKLIRKGTRTIVMGAHTLLFNTKFQRDIWHNAYDIPLTRTRILENVYPPRRAAVSAQSRVFVCAGRNIALKNLAVLERAFARAQERYPKIELDTRSLPHEDHLKRLENAYAVIIPSISEVSSNTAIDAVIAGKPFIMTEDTGTKERLEGCGLFIDTRSEDALVAAIEKLLSGDEYEYLRARINEFSFTHSWKEIAEEIISAAPRG